MYTNATENQLEGLKRRLEQPTEELREAFESDLPFDSFEETVQGESKRHYCRMCREVRNCGISGVCAAPYDTLCSEHELEVNGQ